MNKTRSNEIKKIIERIDTISADISTVKFVEEEYRDMKPEYLRETEEYLISDHACNSMETALEEIDCVIEALNEAIDF